MGTVEPGRNGNGEAIGRSFAPCSTPCDGAERKTKSQGEVEAAVCEGVARFMQSFMGRGPKAIHVHLVADLVVVRVQGVITAAEQHLFDTLPSEKGRHLFKGLRTQLVEASRDALGGVIGEACAVAPVSMHHDISTVTGEEMFVFRLAESPPLRAPRRK